MTNSSLQSNSIRPLRITVASINFHPDHAGIAIYATDLPIFFAERGHRVAMVTGFPYYPVWQKHPGDRRTLFRRETYRGVEVYRGYLYVPTRVTTLKRILHELTFGTFAALNFIRAWRPDAIVVFSPPVLLGVIALFFKYLWRCPLFVNVQDLPIDAATSLGMVKPGLLTRTLLWIEKIVFKHCDAVGTISHGMQATLVAKGVPPAKIGIYPNWIDVPAARWAVEPERFRQAHPQCAGRFTVAYAGNLGVKQGVRTLLDLARRYTENDVHFFIIGDGADKGALLARAGELALKNVTFLPFLDRERYREMLEDIDVVFVAQRPGTGNIFFPSKLLGIMAVGKPMLVSADPESELSRVVSGERIGLVSPFGDVEQLSRNLARLQVDSELRHELAANGRRHVQQYDRARILTKIEDKLAKLVSRAE